MRHDPCLKTSFPCTAVVGDDDVDDPHVIPKADDIERDRLSSESSSLVTAGNVAGNLSEFVYNDDDLEDALRMRWIMDDDCVRRR